MDPPTVQASCRSLSFPDVFLKIPHDLQFLLGELRRPT